MSATTDDRLSAAGRKPDRASAGQAAPPPGSCGTQAPVQAAGLRPVRQEKPPRLAITPPALADMNPARLTRKQKRALSLIARFRLYRGSGNRYGRHPNVIGVETVQELQGLGLARIDRATGPHFFPVLTGAGRQLLDVIQERAKR